jgi:hypothetical protein
MEKRETRAAIANDNAVSQILPGTIQRWSPMSSSGWFESERTKPDEDIGLHLYRIVRVKH